MPYHSLEDVSEKSLRLARTSELRSEETGLGSVRPEISKRQVEFLEVFTACSFMPIKEICQQIRLRQVTFNRWMEDSEPFRKAMSIHYNQVLRATSMSRKQVLRGILDSIDMAKDLHQPNVMITGWKEVGRMCGFYEPDRREITLSVDNKKVIEEMKVMSQESLLQLVSEQDVIEGELVANS